MTYGTIRRIVPKQPQGFEGLVDACRTAPELLEVMLTYDRGDVPAQDLLWGAAAAIALIGTQGSAISADSLPNVMRSRHDVPFDRLVHACAVAGVQGWANPKQLLSGLKPERVHDSLQRELNRLPNSTLPREAMPGHRDALVQLGNDLHYSLHVPSRLNQRPATRLVAPLALGVVFSAFGQTIAVAEPGGPTAGATTAPNEQNDQQRGSGFLAGFEQGAHAAIPTPNVDMAANATPKSNDVKTSDVGAKKQPGAEITVVPERPVSTPESVVSQAPSPTATSTPAESPLSQPSTPQASEAPLPSQSPTATSTQSETPIVPPGETVAPVPTNRGDTLPDPNAPVSGKVTEFPTSPQGAREFWKYASTLTGSKVGIDTPPAAAGTAAKLTGSLLPVGSEGGSSAVAEALLQTPFVSAQLSGTDVEVVGAMPQNPPKTVTEQIVSGIKAMDAPELKGTFFSSIDKKAVQQQETRSQTSNHNNDSSEVLTDKEALLKAIHNVEANKPEWKNIAYVLTRYIQSGRTLENGSATAGRFIIETGSEELPPEVEQYNNGPGRSWGQWGSFNPARDRFGHERQANGQYARGTLRWHAEKNGKDWRDPEEIMDFHFWELENTERTANNAFKSAGHNLRDSVIASLKYERPGSWLAGGKEKRGAINGTLAKAEMIYDAVNKEYQKLTGSSSTEGSLSVLPKEFTTELKAQIADSGRSKAEQALMTNTVATAIKMSDSYPYTVKRYSFLKGDSDFLKAIKKYGDFFKKGGFNIEAGNVFGAPKYDCKVLDDVVAREIGDDGFGTDGNGNRLNTTGLFNQLIATGQTGGKYQVGIEMNPTMESLQPGDQLLARGHIFIWTGPIEGKNGRIYHSIESARGSSRVPSFSDGKATYNWIKKWGAKNGGFMRIRYVQPDSVSN